MLQTCMDKCHKYQHFVSQPRKSQFQICHLYKGGESTGCLVFVFLCFCRILMNFNSNSLWFCNSGTSLSEVLTKTLQKICAQQCITRQHNSLIMMYACQAMMISHCIGFKLQQYIFNFHSLRQESKIRPMDS